MPQLDSLRAFAVFAVMIEHYLPRGDRIRDALPWGDIGVRLFFVLSGFLISRILLSSRDHLELGQLKLTTILRVFFARRFIRLVPVYYGYLLVIALLFPPVRHYLWLFVLYLPNFLFAVRPEVFQVMLAHFWTLAVEEQFYLTWPAILLLVPRRRLTGVLAAIVISGPLFRCAGLAAGFSPHQIKMMMPAHFDTLGLGGLLALLQAGPDQSGLDRARKLVNAGLWVGLPLSGISVFVVRSQIPVADVVLSEAAMGLLCTWLVAGAGRGWEGGIGSVLDSTWLQYVGKISYGIYVYHFNVPGLVREKLAPKLGLTLPTAPWARFPILVAITLVVASLSWYLCERPLNALKSRFEYRASRSA
jgi:peptidoglycan/LPS O-acetylase OafA/YrhL